LARQEALREEKRDLLQRRLTLAQEFEYRVFNGLTAKGGCKCINLTVRAGARKARAPRTDLGLGGWSVQRYLTEEPVRLGHDCYAVCKWSLYHQF
jgi:hypothetical protein